MKKFTKLTIILMLIIFSYYKTFAIENMSGSIKLEDELIKDGIELTSAPKEKTIVDKANEIKGSEMKKLFGQTENEKTISNLESLLKDLEIKKELNNSYLDKIREDLVGLQEKIDKNNLSLKKLESSKNTTQTQLTEVKIENEKLKKDLLLKEKLINDLNNSVSNYDILDAKYKNILSNYVSIKKEEESQKKEEKIEKLKVLGKIITIFIIIYLLKVLIYYNENFKKNNPNFTEYFNLFFTISIIIFFILYIFYIFPELYAVLIFISGSLIFINSAAIGSFVASIIIFRKFKIGDIIKIGNEKGKITKMTPLNIVIKKINEHGIIEKEEINIPNLDFIKDRVNVSKDISLVDNNFSIILSLKTCDDIFEVIDQIKNEILLKMITSKLDSANKNDKDLFKTKYEQTDESKIKVTFYWIGSHELNRNIEKKIIGYLKNYIYNSNILCISDDKKAIEEKDDNQIKKYSLIQDEIDN